MAVEQANWFKAQRLAAGWTQEQVARLADVSLRTVGSAEAGRALKPKIRQRLEKALSSLKTRPSWTR